MYQLVGTAKYRRAVVDKQVDEVMRPECVETGLYRGNAQLLIQSVPAYRVTKIVTTVKRVIAREVFAGAPKMKSKFGGRNFWGKEYFVSTVGHYGRER